MTSAHSTPSVPYGVLTLAQVDELHDHAHRTALYGTLVWNLLDDYATKDQILEGLHTLVSLMIDHAERTEALLDTLKGGA